LDPSPDRTEEIILECIEENFPIRLIAFSRRIGKPLSLMAGLDHCKGDACVVIDADLQDPPELIANMIEKWEQGYEVVIAKRASRKGENFLYLKAARFFYWILEKISEVKVPRDTGDFRLLDSRVVEKIREFREHHGFLRGITAAAGFRTTTIAYDRDPRLTGKTQISLLGAANIALDGIIPFSRVPVRLILLTGLLLLIGGLGAGFVWLCLGLINGFSAHAPFQFLAFLLTFFTGILATAMGILGEYLVRTYEEARPRPLYIVDKIKESVSLSRKSADGDENLKYKPEQDVALSRPARD
jgi:polyisoprenyl-phosphate glycosyltransferase